MADSKGRKQTGSARKRPGPGQRQQPDDRPAVSSWTPGYAQECMMCPFGLLLFAMRQSRPEVTEHLTRAGQELFLALKALVDQAAERWEQAPGMQRIPVR